MNLKSFQCVYCKNPLKVVSIQDTSGVLSCACCEYPLLDGIIYLKRDLYGKKAINLIRADNIFAARLTLLNLRLLLSIPTILLAGRSWLSFTKFIYILRFLGYDRGWSDYLLKRDTKKSYKLATLATKLLRSGDRVLDFGCGVGQLIPPITKRVGSKNLYALDNSFLNLVIARKYFVNSKTILICTDGETGLPIKDEALKALIATDSFHYIKEKKFFIKESARSLSKNGFLFIVQIINSKGIVFRNIHGIRPESLYNMIKSKFKKIAIYSNKSLVDLFGVRKLNLTTNQTERVDDKDEYTLFAAKQNFSR